MYLDLFIAFGSPWISGSDSPPTARRGVDIAPRTDVFYLHLGSRRLRVAFTAPRMVETLASGQ